MGQSAFQMIWKNGDGVLRRFGTIGGIVPAGNIVEGGSGIV
jgi:hypothetical protein